ncbi:MAG: DNA translocase FtsK 4TM domain-containing protein [Bacteroidales bacterium]|nr:DNA translocase FtsK 4TM domain-containing protein [Bacteroidales bacterium]
MKKKKTKSTSAGKRGKHKKPGFFQDDRVRFITGFFFVLFGLYLLFALISYFFTWKADQSFEYGKVFSVASVMVHNWAGKTGAYLSYLLINKWFGVFSFTIPLFIIDIGIRFFKIKTAPLHKVVWFLFFITLLGSLTIAYILGSSSGYLGSGFGGSFGYFTVAWLNSLLGKVGSAFLLIFLNTAFILYYFHIPPFRPKKKPSASNTDSVSTEETIHTGVTTDDEALHVSEESLKTETVLSGKNLAHDQADNRSGKDKDLKETEEDIELTVERRNPGEDQLSEKEISTEPSGRYDPTLELSGYRMPPVQLLKNHETGNSKVSKEELLNNKNKIVETLANYKIRIDKIKATIGPTVTLYEIVPAPGVRISKIKNLEDDIALSLSALGIRIIAPIPGRGTIGIEVPNLHPDIVSMKSMITSRAFQDADYDLPVALGSTISGSPYVFDLARAPHLLVAGATGQGKSVGLNVIIASLLYKKHPAELKFIFVDPKKVELALYSKLEKHYLAVMPDADDPIITDTDKVVNTLNALTIEMDQRYDLLTSAHVRFVNEYNEKFKSRRLNPEKGHRFMPYIVLVIDEFADLIMTAGKNIEFPLTRLAQMGRAVGIHLVIATQRPTTNIITGTIKGNFPTRIAFKVTAMIDSRTILDSPGANQLVGRGDMLIGSGSDLTRIQCAYIDTAEVEVITNYVASQQSYPMPFFLPEFEGEDSSGAGEMDMKQKDPLFEEAARLVVQHQQGSTSLIQRKLAIGYNRAGRIIDQLQAAGVVGPYEGSKARQVLIPDEYTLEQLLRDRE